jgi:integrase
VVWMSACPIHSWTRRTSALAIIRVPNVCLRSWNLKDRRAAAARARKVYGLSGNAAAQVEKFPTARSGEIEVFSPEEVWALGRAPASEQDGAIYLTAAFTGLRMGGLLALRWRDVDFAGQTIRVRASYSAGQLTTPESGKVRAVPMAPDVAVALAQLGRREDWVGDDDLVFVGEAGGFCRRLSAAAALQGGAQGPAASLVEDVSQQPQIVRPSRDILGTCPTAIEQATKPKAREIQGPLSGPWRTRTSNLGIKSPLLYQLS